jgi:hypothetical protein
MRHDHQAGAVGFQPLVRSQVSDLRRAGSQQRTHQIGAVPAEYDDVLFVLDHAEAVEQGGPRFWRLQWQAGRRAMWRGHRMDVRQHDRRLLTRVIRGPEWSQFMAGRKIGTTAYTVIAIGVVACAYRILVGVRRAGEFRRTPIDIMCAFHPAPVS